MPDIYSRLNEIMCDVFGLDQFDATAKTTAADVEGWDSLNNIRLMAEVEQQFGLKLKTSELTGLKNVGDLVTIIQARATRT
jgi:acyl carrier protein